MGGSADYIRPISSGGGEGSQGRVDEWGCGETGWTGDGRAAPGMSAV
jgi:hypothetical protein